MSSVIPPEIEPPKHLQKPLGLSLKSLPLSSPLGTARQPLLLQLKPLQALPPVSQFLQASLLESDIDDGDGNSFNYGDINFTNSTNASNQEPDEKQTPLVENKLTQNPVQLQSLSDAESPMLPESGFGETGNNSDRTNSPNIDIVRSQNLASNPQDFPAVRQTSTTPLPISLSAKVELNQGLLDSPQTTPEIPNVSVQPKNIQRIPETGVSTPENFGQQVTPEIPNVSVQPRDIQRTPETAVSTPENFRQQVTPEIANVPVQPGDIQRLDEPLEKSSIVKKDINPTTYQTPETLVEQILPVQPKSIQPSLKNLIQTSALSTTESSTKDSANEPKVKDILKTESINIQAQINSQHPAISNPLGVRKPLFQESDLSLPNINNNSELLQNSNLPLAGEEIGQEVTNQLMRSTTEHLVTNDSTTDKNIQKVALPQPIEAPESWSNIEELLSETTSNKKNIEETQQQPSTNFHSDPANIIHRSIEKSNPQIPENLDSVALPDSSSNISELMGESLEVKTDNEKHADNFTPVSITAPSSVDPETEPVTLTSPTIQKAPEQTNIQKGSKEGEIKKEDLEIVAQAVYKLIRERLEIDKERRDNYRVSPPNWSSNLILNFSNSKASEGGRDSKNNSQIDEKLQLLTMQIYDLLRHKLEIARERQGAYTGRFY